MTGAEIFLEHDRASFGNTMMWLPVVLTPFVSAAGIAGVANRRMAKTVLPVRCRRWRLVNGMQGTYLHVTGHRAAAGGWRLARYNAEMGPPVFAPLLFSMVGGMGLWPPSCDGSVTADRLPGGGERFPGFDVVAQSHRGTTSPWRRAAPVGPAAPAAVLHGDEEAIASALLDRLLAQDGDPRIPVSS